MKHAYRLSKTLLKPGGNNPIGHRSRGKGIRIKDGLPAERDTLRSTHSSQCTRHEDVPVLGEASDPWTIGDGR